MSEPVEIVIDSLFASDLPTERVIVPGQEGCWVDLRPMDGEAYAEYQQAALKGVKVQYANGVPVGADANPDLREQELVLLCNTVQDLSLRRRRGAGWETVNLPPKGAAGAKRSILQALTRQAREWLARECLRVNGLLEEQAGNASDSSDS